MGLGLSIAYRIVKIHKGTIKAEDNGIKGTRMIIRIQIINYEQQFFVNFL